MTKTYIGLRIELMSRAIKEPEKTIEKFNSLGEAKILDFYSEGKIVAEKRDKVILAKGDVYKNKPKSLSFMNFSIMTPINTDIAPRIAQIINVLGNGRLIREKVGLFIESKSTLNNLTELHSLRGALISLNKMVPGVISSGLYYAPDMVSI